MPKDNVDLICDIGELAGLFERSENLHDFLSISVSTIAFHMRAAVCSLYLYEDKSKELILTANQGLDEKAIGVRLSLGEGIVGKSLKELRPIMTGKASKNPNYKFIAGIKEEKYEAVLAVPIVRGLQRVGVIVVQDPAENYFDKNDLKALKAISSQLATTIENAKLLIDLHEIGKEKISSDAKPFYKGKSAAEGFSQGTAVILSDDEYDVLTATAEDEENPKTLDDFKSALTETENQLNELQRQTEIKLSDVASLIFSAHLLILKDPEFSGSMENLITKGWSPERAITNIVNDYIHLFSESRNPRLKEKVQDVKDLGHRLLKNLKDDNEEHVADYSGQIVIAADLMPSDILKLSAQKVEGVVIVNGSPTSHIAILARSLELPLIFCPDTRLFNIHEGEQVILDANQGNIYVNPSEEIIKSFDALKISEIKEIDFSGIDEETLTKDGTKIKLLSNINLLNDVEVARKCKAEGIGLYRSEFPFIVRAEFPSEEEQYHIYRRLIESMENKEVSLRTLDIGGDKSLPYHEHDEELNPFLGLRAIRFSLENKSVFTQQLRAMLRASADTESRIMFPMISSIDEFEEAKKIVSECVEELAADNVAHNKNPKLGAMVELPAAVEIIEELCKEADFLCIGTNDLVQYILAVDRTNEKVANFYNSFHPAVLRSLDKIADAAIKNDVDLSICGDVVTDARMIPFLLGIGIKKFSMDPRFIARVQQSIKAIHMAEAHTIAKKMLGMGRISEIAEYLKSLESENL